MRPPVSYICVAVLASGSPCAGAVLVTAQPSSGKEAAREEANISPQTQSIDQVWKEATSESPVSDKFNVHSYQTMYGIFLAPWRNTPSPKMLEIGLGCDMNYGPGASVKAWKHVLPRAELWEAEFNADCVNKSRERGQLVGINTVVGDQGDPATVQRWVEETGGKFDIIIDDGGHKNTQIKTSFDVLWPQVNPGGLYFLEDLQVGRSGAYDDTRGAAVMMDVVKDWLEQMVVKNNQKSTRFPLPPDVRFVFCQHEACVVGKAG